MLGLLKAVTTKLVKYKLDFVELKLKKLGTRWAVDFTFFL